MLRLKNIKIENSIAEADYFPEDGAQHGHIVVDLSSGEIICYEKVTSFGMSYPGHARQRLVDLYKSNHLEPECLVIWY